uniref:CcoQ n=1 Tax=Paracoccus denitrificans TaxID=266 RepID=Q51681_PARDE|nr:CcoQ [Paracoccus denitrificans PD1222]
MDRYSFLRELADSWVLLLLVVFFLGTIVFAFRPGFAAAASRRGRKHLP